MKKIISTFLTVTMFILMLSFSWSASAAPALPEASAFAYIRIFSPYTYFTGNTKFISPSNGELVSGTPLLESGQTAKDVLSQVFYAYIPKNENDLYFANYNNPQSVLSYNPVTGSFTMAAKGTPGLLQKFSSSLTSIPGYTIPSAYTASNIPIHGTNNLYMEYNYSSGSIRATPFSTSATHIWLFEYINI